MNTTPPRSSSSSSWPVALIFLAGTTGAGSYGYHTMMDRLDAVADAVESKCQLRLEKVTAEIEHIVWRVEKLETRSGS